MSAILYLATFYFLLQSIFTSANLKWRWVIRTPSRIFPRCYLFSREFISFYHFRHPCLLHPDVFIKRLAPPLKLDFHLHHFWRLCFHQNCCCCCCVDCLFWKTNCTHAGTFHESTWSYRQACFGNCSGAPCSGRQLSVCRLLHWISTTPALQFCLLEV